MHLLLTMQYEINDQLKDKVKLAVDRSTHASKLRDFHEWMDAVKKDTLHRVSYSYSRIFPLLSLDIPCTLCIFRPYLIRICSQGLLRHSGKVNTCRGVN